MSKPAASAITGTIAGIRTGNAVSSTGGGAGGMTIGASIPTAAMPSASADADAILQQGFARHQQGDLVTAQALYRRVLAVAPRNFDACHLLGVVARQRGAPAEAVEHISRAIAIDAGQASAHCNLGAALQDLGQPQLALQSFERALSLKPDYALALVNRGNALRKLGRGDDALRSYEQALLLQPGDAALLCTVANLLQTLDRSAAALACAEQALELEPASVPARYARANALYGLRRHADAVDAYDLVIAVAPEHAEAWCARALALQRLRRFDAALAGYDRALVLRPTYALAHQCRANTLKSLGQAQAAIAAYRLAAEHGADAAEIAYEIAALDDTMVPQATPPATVARLFDRYAAHFDEHLVQYLDYRMPALLNAAIARNLKAARVDTLDLGCGTGLCGVLLRPYSHRLDGVDLSDNMLARARALGLYDTLTQAEIVAFLAATPTRYDLVAAADVFVYVGDLAPVFGAVHAVLREGGGFCFSVEAGEARDVALGRSGRFAHRLSYLETLASRHGFTVCEASRQFGRSEDGVPVPAHVVFLRKTASSGPTTLPMERPPHA